jgi:DNA repair exonuclease SbcCD nuclease subunit
MSTIRLIHLADIHLGFTGPANFVFGSEDGHSEPEERGRYVREVDIERAVRHIIQSIVDQQSIDLVVIAGDLFHKPAPYPRAITYAAKIVSKLRRENIEVVIIDGNHETSSVLHPGSPTSFLRELGAYVSNGTSYRIIRDAEWHSEHLQDKKLAIHALPYGALIGKNSTGVAPLSGYINVLLTHGRVEGMEELNSLHRTSEGIPKELLRKGWDYVALGDWHIHKHQLLSDIPAYYAGGLEALNYGEARLHPPVTNDKYAEHGALVVELTTAQKAIVTTLPNQMLRPVLRLKPIDAEEYTAASLMQQIRTRFDPPLPKEALVLLEINNLPQSMWEQLDHDQIGQLRKSVRRCDIRPNVRRVIPEQRDSAASEATIDKQWEHFLEQYLADKTERTRYVERGNALIDEARKVIQATQAHMGDEGE